MINLFQGDDTGGVFGRTVTICINTPEGVPLEGCKAEFIFDGIVKSWELTAPHQQIEIFYSHNETSAMALGERMATFKIIDAAGKIRTVDNKIPVCVTNRVERVYPGSSKVSFCIGASVRWEDIAGRPKTVVQKVNGRTPDADGNINVETGGTVKQVNGISPDPDTGNVIVPVGVKTINNQKPDADGNIDVEGQIPSEWIEMVSNLNSAVPQLQSQMARVNKKFGDYQTYVDSNREYISRKSLADISLIPVPVSASSQEIAETVNALIMALKNTLVSAE